MMKRTIRRLKIMIFAISRRVRIHFHRNDQEVLILVLNMDNF